MCANSEDVLAKLNVPYAICEMLVSMVTVVGNTLVLIAFKRERKLRRRTNYYIVSLAVADLLVGLIGIPCAILSSVGLPKQIVGCLVSLSLLVVLCTISIFSLVAVSVDRYWAVLHPMSYTRNVTSKFALGIICLCWIAGGLVGFLPLFGWHTHVSAHGPQDCSFTKIMSYNYLVFLYFATIVGPALLLAAFYSHIYNVILKQLRQMVTMNETGSCNNGFHNSTSVHILSEARRKEVKATQNLSVIVLFFILCWMPLYTINCIQAFCPECVVSSSVLNSCIILSHLNSAGNPLLYAYRLSDFRSAFRSLFFGSVSSSAENVIFAGRHDASDFERSFAKSRNASVAFDPQKFLFAKSTPKLFKFGERESNSDVSMSPMRAKVARSDSSEQFLASDQNTRPYDFHRSVSNYTQHSLEGGSHPENRYPYFNGDYVDELPYDCNGRKRIRSVLEDPSYILMINDDNISERTDGTDENNSSKLNVFETRKKILRRHSTNI